MAWTNSALAIIDLRAVLYDGPTDKLAWKKKVFGDINGSNVWFKTFEDRRVTDFTSKLLPTIPYVNGCPVATQNDNPITGDFSLVDPPIDGDIVEATYYYQWFIDSELDTYLRHAAQFMSLGQSYINIPDGLTPAALQYAASEAYGAASVRLSIRASQGFRLEDTSSKDMLDALAKLRSMAKDFQTNATKLRDDYYERQGQSKAPLFVSNWGCVPEVTPRR